MTMNVNETHFRRWSADAAFTAYKLIANGGSLAVAREELEEAMRWLGRADSMELDKMDAECAAFDAAMRECAQ